MSLQSKPLTTINTTVRAAQSWPPQAQPQFAQAARVLYNQKFSTCSLHLP